MAYQEAARFVRPRELPMVRRIRSADLWDALSRGYADFSAMPTHVVFASMLYPVIGFILFRLVFNYNLIPLLFPLLAGFALLGPFAAVGLYEISRARERGETATWRTAMNVFKSRSFASILELGAGLLALFLTWIAIAYFLYLQLFDGVQPVILSDFLQQVLGTREGLTLLFLGNAIGFVFAVVAFAISVVSFPLLVDRDVGAATAVVTSVSAVLRNPVVMVQWGLLVAAALAIGAIPALLGLAVVVPILGHATWHLYRKLIV